MVETRFPFGVGGSGLAGGIRAPLRSPLSRWATPNRAREPEPEPASRPGKYLPTYLPYPIPPHLHTTAAATITRRYTLSSFCLPRLALLCPTLLTTHCPTSFCRSLIPIHSRIQPTCTRILTSSKGFPNYLPPRLPPPFLCLPFRPYVPA